MSSVAFELSNPIFPVVKNLLQSQLTNGNQCPSSVFFFLSLYNLFNTLRFCIDDVTPYSKQCDQTLVRTFNNAVARCKKMMLSHQ
ncbi:hypothetical protein CEXT_122941 [Caerostris extrusa]|uniref:Uncharacterized protein n=1 Tax=Caerostris extrusa TaxID=172846 RepID=A0AAV4VH34_CAEEX|nr:hypothetical protein CEXT_122941 [Caerostris extrusa]